MEDAMIRRLYHSPDLILPIVMGVVIVLLTTRDARADDLDPDQIKAVLHTTSDIEGLWNPRLGRRYRVHHRLAVFD